MTTEPNSRHDPDEVIGECAECGDDVTRSNVKRAHSYRALFCSTKCQHTHKSKRGDRHR